MINSDKLYQVWWSRGHGTHRGPRFRLLQDALRYLVDHSGDASYALRCPDGHWYEFGWGSHHIERLHREMVRHGLSTRAERSARRPRFEQDEL